MAYNAKLCMGEAWAARLMHQALACSLKCIRKIFLLLVTGMFVHNHNASYLTCVYFVCFVCNVSNSLFPATIGWR